MEMNRPNSNVIQSDGTRITTLQNILPDAKPGYDGEGSRTSASWSEGDELLLKVNIKDGEDVAYTAWMTLQCTSNGTWKIKSGTTDKSYYYAQKDNDEIKNYGDLPLVTPAEGFTLSGEGNLEAITPEEITTPSLEVELIYAPDLEWKNSDSGIALGLKENPTTTAPEYWKVELKDDSTTEYEWKTTLARVCVKTGKAGEEVSLTSNSFTVSDNATGNGNYTATTIGTDGIAYFYGTLSETTSDFKVSLKTVMLDDAAEATFVFVPTVLFEAMPLNEVTLVAGNSYLIDGTDARTQALLDSQPAETTLDENSKTTYKVSGVKGLLQWAADLNKADGKINFSLELENDIILPQYQIKSIDEEDGGKSYYYDLNEPITDNSNKSNWITVNRGSTGDEPNKTYFGLSGTVNGNNKVITGLRMTDKAFIDMLEDDGKIKNLNFVDAKIVSSTSAAVIVSENKGKITSCTVADSEVSGVGNVGAIASLNKGTVSDCHNNATDVICNNTEQKTDTPTSELVGGIVGNNNGEQEEGGGDSPGIVTGCTNSGNVICEGSRGNNFTGGIVGHNWGIVSYCENTGSVKGSTNCNQSTSESNNNNYYTSVGGIVGNCSFGRIMGCFNSGKVKSSTSAGTDTKKTSNRVGGVVGSSGTWTNVVACGNIGTLEYISADYNYVGGIVGSLYHSYKSQYNESYAGRIYGSWTKDVIEIGENTEKDGIGNKNSECSVTSIHVFIDESNVSGITGENGMNAAIEKYNNNLSDVEKCNKTWSWTEGSNTWPILQ